MQRFYRFFMQILKSRRLTLKNCNWHADWRLREYIDILIYVKWKSKGNISNALPINNGASNLSKLDRTFNGNWNLTFDKVASHLIECDLIASSFEGLKSNMKPHLPNTVEGLLREGNTKHEDCPTADNLVFEIANSNL